MLCNYQSFTYAYDKLLLYFISYLLSIKLWKIKPMIKNMTLFTQSLCLVCVFFSNNVQTQISILCSVIKSMNSTNLAIKVDL